MLIRSVVSLLVAISSAAISAPGWAATMFGPSAYLSSADIPASFYQGGAPLVLEDLEDNSLDASLSASAGAIIGFAQFGGLIDSVDADDGTIDGNGQNGRSWFNGDGAAGVTFTYVGAEPLPTAFGIVWTDGGGIITLQAFDGNGVKIVDEVFAGIPDVSVSGTTAEDRFLGVTDAGGIKAIRVSNSSGGIELDHIQYGTMMAPVPEPTTWALMLLGLAGTGFAVQRRRHR
jgi:hypothetical protein